VLFAAKVAKVDEIYQVGGPAAIAALAYGTKTVPAVDIIVGPGNAYVNEAKRQVFGKVGIDSLAGPSEVAIIADKTARVAYVLADMAAQAEHDPAAKAYLLTDSEELLSEVKKKLPRQIAAQTELIFCRMDEAVERVNELAPEHLEIMTKNAAMLAKKVKNAGAVFVGQYTPTAIGDYWAGPSHILPTAGTARFSSVLSVETFLKRTSYISYGAKAVEKAALQIETLARAEGLEDHRNSVVVRRK
jgi:histidinol dehydrogenase